MSTDVVFYGNLLGEIKIRIRQAQYRAAIAVNAELVHLFGNGPLPVAHLSADTKEPSPVAQIPWAHNI